MVIYTDEHKLLSALNECLKNVDEVDIDLYEMINNYLENPFNISNEELEQIRKFVGDNQKEPIKFDIEALAPNQKELSEQLSNIKPSKLNKPTAPIVRMYGKCPYKTVIPIYTDTKKLELKPAA